MELQFSSQYQSILFFYDDLYFSACHFTVIHSSYTYVCSNRVTREYRESLAKNAKALFQKFKDHSRDIQNRYIREVKKKEKEVSSDLAHSVQQQIHTLTEQFVSEAEKIMIAKQNELLGKD